MENYASSRSLSMGKRWRRPKNKVYDCNYRDAERHFQDIYKHYLDVKEEANDRRNRTLPSDDEINFRFSRSSSIDQAKREAVAQLEARREGTFVIGMQRQSSVKEGSRSANTSTDAPSWIKDRLRKEGSEVPSTTRVSSRASSLVHNQEDDTQENLMDIERRLERLKKLREELGLPSEVNVAQISSSATEPSTNSTGSTGFSLRKRSSSETRSKHQWSSGINDTSDTSAAWSKREGTRNYGLDSYDKYKLEKSSGGFSRPAEYTNEYEYSQRSRLSRFKEKPDISMNGCETRFERPSRLGKVNASSSSYDDGTEVSTSSYKYLSRAGKSQSGKESSSFSSYNPRQKLETSSDSIRENRLGKAHKSDFSSDDINLNDDSFFADIKKKFPTSEEILERIRKMDSDL